jgi:hypothetical protein
VIVIAARVGEDMTDDYMAKGRFMVRRPQRRPIFDDKSRLLDRFGLLLVVTVSSLVILSLVDIGPRVSATAGRWESALASLLVGATLLLALRASGLARRWQRIADVIVIVVVGSIGFLAAVATLSDITPAPTTAAPPLVVLLALAAPLAVVRRLVQHREVKRGTLLGAISGYLLLPIAFFYLFLSSATWTNLPFFGAPQPTTSYMYFSLTTITTTGYGDLTAAAPFGRLLAMSEAVTGQVYLVTFVAMLVGLFAATRGRGIVPLE